jgi:hypothetical protein
MGNVFTKEETFDCVLHRCNSSLQKTEVTIYTYLQDTYFSFREKFSLTSCPAALHLGWASLYKRKYPDEHREQHCKYNQVLQVAQFLTHMLIRLLLSPSVQSHILIQECVLLFEIIIVISTTSYAIDFDLLQRLTA